MLSRLFSPASLIALLCMGWSSLAVSDGIAQGALDDAALTSRGATIHITSADPKRPYNDRWNKPEGMLKSEKAAGPIIHKLNTGVITVTFPVPLSVQRVGLHSSDYKGSFAMAKDIEISSPGHALKQVTLEQDGSTIQYVDYVAKTDTIQIKITSIYPPSSGKKPKTDYGSINKIEALVTEKLDDMFALPSRFVTDAQAHTMPTANLGAKPFSGVIGSPRKVTEHPLTIWDKADIAAFKAQIETEPLAKEAFKGIVAYCDNALALKRQVPDEPDLGTNPKVANMHTTISSGIANLGIGYALTGNEAYAKEAKRLLLGYAAKYDGYPLHAHPKFRHDKAKWSWQRLGEAIWLIPCAWGYDLIHNSPSLSDEERNTIEDKFLMAVVKTIMSSSSVIAAKTNWSVISNAAVMIASRVCGNEDYYQKSINGLTPKQGERGGMYFHLDKGIDDDGLWAEGAIGYQFMAIRGLVVCAEIMWRDGIDVWSYRNGRMKLVFDSPIWYTYPGGASSPAVHDSGSASLFGRDAHLYQYAQRRYGDKTYNSILSQVTPTFESIYNLFLPACDFKAVDPADLPSIPSIHFPGVGFTINRTGDGDDAKYLFMDYGPNRSHGHADKLNFTLYALGQELFADGGSAWYSTDLYRRYYPFSQAHNTLTANETSQIRTGGRLEAYGTLDDIAVVRASCDSAVPGLGMDRTMLLAGDRLYDIFLVDSALPYTLDLPYHSFGTMEQSLASTPWADHPKEKKGYVYYSNPVAKKTDEDWQARWVVPRGHVDMHYVGEPNSDVIFATTPKAGVDIPTAMIRRKAKHSVFRGVFDIVPKGAKASVIKSESLPGSDELISGIQTQLADGVSEIMISNFTRTEQTIAGITTDARVAFLRRDGDTIHALMLVGGTRLHTNGLDVSASAGGLWSYRLVRDNIALVANLSDSESTLTLKGVLGASHLHTLDADGNRTGTQALTDGIIISAKGVTRAELTVGESDSVASVRAKERRVKLEAQAKRIATEKARLKAELDKQYSEAKTLAMDPASVVLVQAEDFIQQEGGKVGLTDKKVANYGKSFSGWNARNHALSYEFDVPKAGLYQVAIKYCREGGEAKRSIEINGEYPFSGASSFVIAGTGGWSNGADNWKFHVLNWPLLEKPFLVQLNAGKNTMRLNNVAGGGVNLDYVAFYAPFTEPDRERFEP